jgi:hypothetical protein
MDEIAMKYEKFILNVENILQNIVNPIEHCYEHEQCYVIVQGLLWKFETKTL